MWPAGQVTRDNSCARCIAMGGTSYFRGEFCEAREHLEELLGLYDPQKHRGHEYLSISVNVGVLGLFYLSWTLFSLGYPDQALTRAREALALARELSHPFSEAVALYRSWPRPHGASRVEGLL